jgi:NADH dehydrogenase (ubiquinone) Fe-S protein 6
VPSDAPALDPVPREMKELVPEEKARHMQAPNRQKPWSKSQRPREMAMVGPRFEQTILSQQPAPYAAIELIHQQKVRWSKSRVVACDGGEHLLGYGTDI